MRKQILVILAALTLLPAVDSFAQRHDDDWRSRRYVRRDNAFEITPFLGYTWGGTIFADNTSVFGQDVQVAPSANFGIDLGIPLGDSGLKLTLMANRQSSNLETESGIFEPGNDVADIDLTYLHAGIQIPFATSRSAMPYFLVSGGLANFDPQVSGVSDETRFSASAGIGVKVPVSDVLSLRFEGRGYYAAIQDEDDCRICDYFYNDDFYQGQVNMGLGFRF